MLPSEQAVGDTAQRVDVGTPVHVGTTERDFRRHVAWCSQYGPFHGQHRAGLPRGGVLDQAEVEHLHEVIVRTEPADQDVRGLDVAVDQTARVRLAERVTDLPQ